MVDKNWTLEDALAANDKALTENPSLSSSGPSLPLHQWFALHRLDVCQRYYDDGDSYWLMTAIRICANHDLALPEWAAMAYIKAYDKVNNARARSWNTVFGDPYPKGSHLSAIRKRITLKFAVLNKIHAILAMSPETPIDEYLFDCVGKELNIGKTLASEYYYSAKKEAESIGK